MTRVRCRTVLVVALLAGPAFGQVVRKSPFHPPRAVQVRTNAEWKAVPLSELCARLSKDHGVEIVLDTASLEDEAIPPDEPITLSAGEVTLASALDLVLPPLGLTWELSGQRIDVRSQVVAESRYSVVTYDCTNLGRVNPNAFVNVVRTITAPVESWEDLGGGGSARMVGARLDVEQSAPAHRSLATMLRQLDRAAVGSRRNKLTPAELAETRIRRKLAARSEEAFVDVPLDRAVRRLTEATEVPIVLDEISLEDEGIEFDVPVNLAAARSLGEALDAMLKPLEATWYVRDEVVHVSSVVGAEETFATRVYDVSHLLGGGAEAFVERLTQRHVESWVDAGGRADVHVIGRFAVVGQSLPVHREFARLLAKRR